MKSIQHYKCEKCNLEGQVKYNRNSAVYSVINLIEDNHKKCSPKCNNPVSKIRVICKDFSL